MSVAKSSFLFASGTLFSRVSGVMRESVVGAVFGASLFMDAFVVAFRIPNLLRELLAEGALGSSFTKVYSSVCAEDKEAASKLLIQTLQFVILICICVCGLGITFAGPLVKVMTMFDGSRSMDEFQTVTASLTQLMFPFIGFAAFGAIVQGALYQRGGFFLAAVAPILFNLGSIAGALWLGNLSQAFLPQAVTDYFGNASIFGLALGTLLGGAAQSGIQLWGIWKPLLKGKKLWPSTWPWSPEIRKVIVLMGPMVIAASAGQINVVVNTNFATSLGTGAVTWLYFAFRLLQLPIGMFGVAVGAAVLPALSKAITEAHGKVDLKASREAINAMDLVLWLMIPCMMFMHGSALDITRILYQAGRFTAADTDATAIAIQAYSYGLAGYGLIKVLNSYYYAVDRTRFPMVVSLISIAGNYIANSLLVKEYGHQGLAITASITLSMNALLLTLGMSRDGIHVDRKQVVTSIALLGGASIALIWLRGMYMPALHSWAPADMLGLHSGVVTLKMNALVRLVLDGVVVALIFGGVGLARLGKTPKAAFAMLKRRRK